MGVGVHSPSCIFRPDSRHKFWGSSNIQTVALGTVLNMLGDEDARVREASADALVKLVPRLFYAVCSARQTWRVC